MTTQSEQLEKALRNQIDDLNELVAIQRRLLSEQRKLLDKMEKCNHDGNHNHAAAGNVRLHRNHKVSVEGH